MSWSRILLTVLGSLALGAGAADSYQLDPVHSTVIFKIKHLNTSYTYGRFNNPTGTVIFDEADPTKSSVSLELKADSVDTDNEKRDQHLKNPDFFNAKQFPMITFKSKAIKKNADGQYDVTGDLTLLGVTKEITAKFTHVGSGKDPWGGVRTGFDGSFSIKRSDFGMKQMLEAVGDDVHLIVGIEAVKK